MKAGAEIYAKGLDFTVLTQFHDHEGCDGIIFESIPLTDFCAILSYLDRGGQLWQADLTA